MRARLAIAAGALLTLGATFLPNVRVLQPVYDAATDEMLHVEGDTLHFWQVASGADVVLAVLCAAAVLLALLGLRSSAAVAAVAVAGYTIPLLVERLAVGGEGRQVGVWLMAAGGLVAFAGAVLALRQRSTRPS